MKIIHENKENFQTEIIPIKILNLMVYMCNAFSCMFEFLLPLFFQNSKSEDFGIPHCLF